MNLILLKIFGVKPHFFKIFKKSLQLISPEISKEGMKRLIMRLNLFILILFTAFMQVSATTFAQKVNINKRNVSVIEILEEVKKQTGYGFVYNSEMLKSKKTSIEGRNLSLKEVLDLCLEDLPLSYNIVDNNILIKERVVSKPKTPIITSEIQEMEISGRVVDQNGVPLPGVTIRVQNENSGTFTNQEGNYQLRVKNRSNVLVYSFLGFISQEVTVGNQAIINIELVESLSDLKEVVVVGYGTQRKSDITGSVASISKDKLEMVPNLNIAQAIQGAVPGVMIRTTTGGAASGESMMVRGRNSIAASNDPLVVLDGIPYGGSLRDINVSDVQSIEILKDASAAAIYGSRGANGVILVTSKEGIKGKTQISYDGKYGIQRFANLPDIMDGEQFYNFKIQRLPESMTPSEQGVYDSGDWVNWLNLGLRDGNSHQHNVSISGGAEKTKFYIGGGLLKVKGLAVNDDYLRATNRVNIDTKVASWLTVGTRTQLSYDDRGGVSPNMTDLFWRNPLATAYDENGNLTLTPNPDDPVRSNPLESILFKNLDESFQVVTNNFAVIDFPFLTGLSYRLNTGLRMKFVDQGTYRGRDTKTGLDARGSAETERTRFNNTVIENIVSYNKTFGKHSVFATGVYSYEGDKNSSNSLSASGFPHDFLTWYSAAQADLVNPEHSFNETVLISQMLRLNYAYDSRYLLTLTGRRDGYSGFGTKNKWGVFPSVALAWNFAKESFFPLKGIFSEFKPRVSYGLNGNQAVGAYESISRLDQENMVSLGTSLPGYVPSKLGQDNLGWESSSSFNLGIDFRNINGRISGDINYYKTNTRDLLLNRTISSVHGITSITENIGKTENTGFELSINTRNITNSNFTWSTSGNLSLMKNKIVSLYGDLDDTGVEINDISNNWFIGQPILVNYGYVFDGVWQSNELEKATSWGSKPGYIKIKDINNDGIINSEDRQLIGQQDPKFIWGLTNTLSYKNISLNVFVHGVHGVTMENELMSDLGVTAGIRNNTINKNWWTPQNPSNEFYMNHIDAHRMGGVEADIYESADFVRVKDVTLAYDFSKNFAKRLGLGNLKFYVSGRNLATFTKWRGLDPELSDQVSIPLQKEYVFGLDLSF
jgi:TonB-linked SusC/RagA family outer membrane protein